MDTWDAWLRAVDSQMGAAITTLENAIRACPDELWEERCGEAPFWRAAYHTLVFLDVYAGATLADYEPPEPFTRSELEEDGVPPRTWTKEELLGYAEHGRARLRARLAALAGEDPGGTSGIPWLGERGLSAAETLLYGMRHVQHHAAQLNLFLRRAVDHGAPWVSRGPLDRR